MYGAAVEDRVEVAVEVAEEVVEEVGGGMPENEAVRHTESAIVWDEEGRGRY